MKSKWMIVFLLEIIFTIVSSLSRQEPSHATVRTIQSEDGDIIDCIDMYKQPAFDHPALKDHKIQLKPSYDVKMEITSDGEKQDSATTTTTQKWHKSGTCPKGTIPVRRNTIPKKLASKRQHPTRNYGRKPPMHSQSHYDKKSNENETVYLQLKNHSLAFLHTEGFAYLGAKGDIQVWNPLVESDDEYSTSHVALKSGPYYNFEAIESGWAVNPGVYGDRQTRLFVYWTGDASKETGCFDLTCPGFVQTSNELALGAAIYPISNLSGLPYQITIFIHRDPNTSNWWVQYGERINIGYWPSDLFGWLRSHAETVQWGGEVYSTRVGTHPHTATDMGSGQFPDWVSGMSGSVKRIRVLENNMILRFPQWVFSFTDEYDCYSTYYISDYVPDPQFFYGGPGQNPRCP
ncbi:hypothetical protein ABFX02_05G132600 [Erythranthe guttata]